MLWILILPAVAVIALLAYLLGYRQGRKAGERAARLREEAARKPWYCGTALGLVEVPNEFRRPEGKYDEAKAAE